MNFVLVYENADGFTAYMFNFTNGKMDWAVNAEGAKRTDASEMAEYFHEANDSGLSAKTVITD